MFKRKIMLGTSAGLIGALAIAGAAFAQEGPADGGSGDSVRDRVAEILGVDREALDSAMSTARTERREAMQNERLAALVEAGTITQAQVDEIDAWKDSRPEVMNELKRLGRGHGVGGDRSIEARLAILVEQEVITQAEADDVIAWREAKPEYLDELRSELRGERDSRRGRHGHGDHQRGRGHGFGGRGYMQHAPGSGTGTSFTLPNGTELSV